MQIRLDGGVVDSREVPEGLLVYLPSTNLLVSVEQSAAPSRMAVADAPPEAEGGVVMVAAATDGPTIVLVPENCQNLMIHGVEEGAHVLDISHPAEPVYLQPARLGRGAGSGVYLSVHPGQVILSQ